MKLGNKHYKPYLSLGMKHYKPQLTLGMKHYGQDHHNTSHMTHNTPDGIIHNDFNSREAQREPMKHTNFKPKKYIDQNHSNIEKAKKKHDEDKHQHFV
jgi:hypothetical protein